MSDLLPRWPILAGERVSLTGFPLACLIRPCGRAAFIARLPAPALRHAWVQSQGRNVRAGASASVYLRRDNRGEFCECPLALRPTDALPGVHPFVVGSSRPLTALGDTLWGILVAQDVADLYLCQWTTTRRVGHQIQGFENLAVTHLVSSIVDNVNSDGARAARSLAQHFLGA